MAESPRILLATCADWPNGGDEAVLVDLFAGRGVSADWVLWDDPDVDWASADLVAIRTTWDYSQRLADYLAWTERVAGGTRLVNAPSVVRWNTHKGYLNEIEGWGLPIVPTRVVTDEAGLGQALATYERAVVKPAVAVGGEGLVVWHAGDPLPEVTATLVVQPLVDSVRTRGEVSVFVMGGRAVAQVAKRPAADEVRVHEHRGGTYDVEALEPVTVEISERAVDAVASRFGVVLPYARVDLLSMPDGYVVSELELTEPSLYVGMDAGIETAYVDAVTAIL